jgi:hypothetical protein
MFDATFIGTPHMKHANPTNIMGPFRLNVGNSPIQRPEKVAAFLSEHFPTLCGITFLNVNSVTEAWSEVDEMLFGTFSD